MTFLPEPSGFIEWMRPPLSSRTNNRPPTLLDTGPGFAAKVSVITISFQVSGLDAERFPGIPVTGSSAAALRGARWFAGAAGGRGMFRDECGQRRLRLVGANLHAEDFILGSHRRLGQFAKGALQ